jgi:putative radical SAM enzyme (TIGR03279 family)
MPPGARASTLLYDDDYRLSFLEGNFVTLSNLDQGDVDRILAMRLSPLYVSVHSTDLKVRLHLFRSRHSARGLETLWRLLDGGITVHAQIVMVPGLNDGDALAQTVDDLAKCYPRVASVGVVPVGLTAHRAGQPEVAPVSPDLARQTLACMGQWQDRFRRSLGTRFCFAADELYLRAAERLPSAREYEGFPQRENGIGLCALFRSEFERAVGRGRAKKPGSSHVILTGISAAPFLREVIDSSGLGSALEIVPVENRYLGETVTVAGLLAGEDLWEAIRVRGSGSYLIPAVCVNASGLLIDDLPLLELRRRVEGIGGRLRVVADAAGLVRLVRERCEGT